MKNYDFRDYYTNTRSRKLQESRKQLDREIKSRQLKESKTSLYRTSKRLVNFYLNEATRPIKSVKQIAEQVVRDTNTDKPHRVRAYVHETIQPSKIGKAVNKLPLEEQNTARYALYQIQRSYPRVNLNEHFRSITKQAAEKYGGDPHAVFSALREDNMHWQDYDMNTGGNDDSWYDSATNEMLERVRNGERAIDVANELARRYASEHPDQVEAFEFAYDALSKRAWEHGLKENKKKHSVVEDADKLLGKRPKGTPSKGPHDFEKGAVYKVNYKGKTEQARIEHGHKLGTNVTLLSGPDKGKMVALRPKDIQSKIDESEYQGRDVELNKPFRNNSGSGKFAVYVTDPKDNETVKKVTFGDKDMEIKRDDPEARKNFRARHNCDQYSFDKDRDKAGYWSCKFWQSNKTVSELLSENDIREDVTEMNPVVAVYGPDGKVIGRMDLKTAAHIHDVPYRGALSEINRVGHYTDENITFEKQARMMDEDDEDGLEDACWDGYTAYGTKKKNGKTVPNCVPESADLEEDDDPCWDDYEMVGMKKKGGKEVPNCVPKESMDEDIAQLLKRAGITETWNDDLIGGDEDTPDADWIVERFHDLSNPRMMGQDYDDVRHQIVRELEDIGYEWTEAEEAVENALMDAAEKQYNRQHNFESTELEEHEDYESYVEPWRKKGFDIKVKDLPGEQGGKLFNVKGGGKSFTIREPRAGVYRVGSSARDFDSFDSAMKDMLGERMDEAALKDGPVKDKVVKAMKGVIQSHGGESWDNIKSAAKELAEWYYEDLGFKSEAQAFEAIIRAYREKSDAPMFAEATHVKARRAKADDLQRGKQVYHPAHGTGTVKSAGGGKIKVDFGQGKGVQSVKDTEVQVQESTVNEADPFGGAMFSPYGEEPDDASMMQAEEDAKAMARELLSQYDEYDEAVHHDVVSDLKGWLENNGLNAGWDQRNLSRLVTEVANEMNLTRSSYMDMMKRLAGLHK